MSNLIIKNLSMRYEKKLILDNLALEVKSGELLVIVGESGCGKTSLLKIIAGILEPESGEIIVNGEDIINYSPKDRNIGYVPQGQILFPHMKIRDNITFGLKARKLSKQIIEERLQWIAELTQISDLLDRYPYEISGGQKQRVALARAMAIRPNILLLDEPLSSIDATGRESLALTIRRVQKETETTTLYVTHNQEEARLICDRVAVIYDGKIQQIGKVMDVTQHPKNYLIAKTMGTPNVWPILFQQNEEKNTIISTPLLEIKLPLKLDRKRTGIIIPPLEIKIAETEQEINKITNEKKDDNYVLLTGKIKAVMQRSKNLYRVVTEIRKESIVEYIKIDIEDNQLAETLLKKTDVTLIINTNNIILI